MALKAVVITKRNKKKIMSGLKKDTSNVAVSVAASVLLKKCCHSMNGQAYRVGFILHLSGAKELVCFVFSASQWRKKIGMCCFFTSCSISHK